MGNGMCQFHCGTEAHKRHKSAALDFRLTRTVVLAHVIWSTNTLKNSSAAFGLA